MAKITQTAGRNALGTFAPEFAHFNDDLLFGENWNNEDIDLKTRSIITVVALMAQGITDSMQDGQRAGQYSTLQKRFGTRKKQKNNLAETARQDRFAQSTDVYAVKASNYKGLRRGSPV